MTGQRLGVRALGLSAVMMVASACGSDGSDPPPGSGGTAGASTAGGGGSAGGGASAGGGGAAAECSESDWSCSDDAIELTDCDGGQWRNVHCMLDEMGLCEDGQCVGPWAYGSPAWSKCESEPLATTESLQQKAAYYDDIAKRLHVHPQLKWMMGVTLPCAAGDCSEPAVPHATATYQDVEYWHSGENDGLWSSLYLTSQAYRYAVTGDAEALEMINLLLEGQQTRMAITGVPGLYTRQLIPPGIPGLSCPTDLNEYVPDAEKDDNQWVRVGTDGCIQTVDPNTMQFVSSSHCGLDPFADWCWLDNVSQDEYSGHMLAHAAVAVLVDDAEAQQKNRELLQAIGQHLVDHGLELWDWDGRRTEHGQLWPMAVFPFVGFQAAMSLAFLKTAASGTGDTALQAYYDECLLKVQQGSVTCNSHPAENPNPYDQLVGQSGLNLLGCQANWNNYSMHMLSLHTLLLLEWEPAQRAVYQAALTDDIFMSNVTDRPLYEQNNAFWDFIFAADKALGPLSDGPAYGVVENGVCMLRQFAASQHLQDVTCPPANCIEVCLDRKDQPMTAYARPAAERCAATFVWWQSPYSMGGCTENRRVLKPPTGYLLPYWMGRYYGFIDASM